jgi:hypothetical protein
MTLLQFMTEITLTKRVPSISGGKIGDPVTHLENVKVVPRQLFDTFGTHTVRAAIGLEGTAMQLFQTYTESHAHIDDSAPVTQVPDIISGDRLILDGVTYQVRFAEKQTLTISFGETLYLYITEDKRS